MWPPQLNHYDVTKRSFLCKKCQMVDYDWWKGRVCLAQWGLLWAQHTYHHSLMMFLDALLLEQTNSWLQTTLNKYPKLFTKHCRKDFHLETPHSALRSVKGGVFGGRKIPLGLRTISAGKTLLGHRVPQLSDWKFALAKSLVMWPADLLEMPCSHLY